MSFKVNCNYCNIELDLEKDSTEGQNVYCGDCYEIKIRIDKDKELYNLCKSLFIYNKDNGKLYWENPAYNCKRLKGKEVGTVDKSGYLAMMVKKKNYKVHQICFLMHHKYKPKMIDHINGIKQDNRISNIRECTSSENGQNRTQLSKNNTSGYKGICLCKRSNKWNATILYKGVRKSLGYYENKEDAATAYNNACEKYYKDFGRKNIIRGNV